MLTNSFFQNRTVQKVIIIILLILVFYAIRSMINIILITFIITYLMNRVTTSLNKKININRKVMIAVLYSALVFSLTYCIYKYLPGIISQISLLIKQIGEFYTEPQEPMDSAFLNYVLNSIKSNDLTGYVKQGFDILYIYIGNIGKWGLQIFLALILSLIFLLEKPRIQEFTAKFKHSKISPFYTEMEYFGSRFVRSFGKVLEVQFIIATVNCLLSTIMLWILGFPQLLGLALLIFLLGLIPVAGVVISLIPLCTIAFSIGGITKVVWVLILVAVIHALESYVLNPKLMSSKTNLPVFYTFVVLVFSEHFFGVWGLIIGIPVFVFLLDVLNVMKDSPDEALDANRDELGNSRPPLTKL
ncbi:AI-2E family transporter [Paenibacillus eucommiae]|nr:AI-2E family transporter [Paenibacillus eucommiae]